MSKRTEALKLALEAYLCREMPAGTIIGDPKWWVPKIAMAILEVLAEDSLGTEQPAQRKPLTEEELYKVFPAIATYHEANKTLYRSIARAIEAAHGIKENT